MHARGRLAIIALLLLTAWCWNPAQGKSGHSGVEDVQSWTLSREGARGLRLTTRGGNVEVVGGRGDQLRVRATRKAQASREADARAFLSQMRIERQRDGDQWVLTANWAEPRSHRVDSASASFEVQVPPGMDLEVQTGGGNVAASGVRDSRLRTGGGNVTLKDVDGRVDLQTGGGNIGLDDCSGPATLETGGGNLDLRQVRGAVKAHTGGGNVTLDGRALSVEVKTGGGNISIGGVEGPVKATTGAGNIDVRVVRAGDPLQVELGTGRGEIALSLPESASARVEAGTGGGRVSIEPNDGARFNREHSQVEAVLGDGRGTVRARAGTGGIRITRTGSR
jgi:DUF4097 and DUF4098 domain-containing protein YvlB